MRLDMLGYSQGPNIMGLSTILIIWSQNANEWIGNDSTNSDYGYSLVMFESFQMIDKLPHNSLTLIFQRSINSEFKGQQLKWSHWELKSMHCPNWGAQFSQDYLSETIIWQNWEAQSSQGLLQSTSNPNPKIHHQSSQNKKIISQGACFSPKLKIDYQHGINIFYKRHHSNPHIWNLHTSPKDPTQQNKIPHVWNLHASPKGPWRQN